MQDIHSTWWFPILTSSWWFPILYLYGIGIVFYIFKRWNQLRLHLEKFQHSADSYFGRNFEKEVYLELAELYSPQDKEGLKVLTNSLMKRAMSCVRRIWQIREEKGPLSQLVKQGGVGEEVYEKVCRAEESTEEEVQQVMEEAELYRPGWKDTIFQEATQLNQLMQSRQPQDVSEPSTPEASSPEEAEEKRQQIIEELLQEEEEEKKRQGKKKKKSKK